MTLSAEEYHDHLKTTAVRAGFSFDEVVLPQQHRVTVNGLGFRYLDWGTAGKPPILFLHGGRRAGPPCRSGSRRGAQSIADGRGIPRSTGSSLRMLR